MNATAQMCPRCGGELGAEIVREHDLHRCGRCGGVWLRKEVFRDLCDPAAVAGQTEVDPPDDTGERRRPEPVRYLRCPACNGLMMRMNFARVSGVIVDVCRPHGAWLDAGELLAIRRFVRDGGVERMARTASPLAERTSVEASTPRAGFESLDWVDVLAGIPDRWDVPSRRSRARRFLRAAVLAAAGGWLLWGALTSGRPGVIFRRDAVWIGGAGRLLILAALRALGAALDASSRDARGGTPQDRAGAPPESMHR